MITTSLATPGRSFCLPTIVGLIVLGGGLSVSHIGNAASIPLSALPAGGATFTIPEPVAAPAPELFTLSITGAVFPAGFTAEVDLLDPAGTTGQGLISDRILFDNGGPNVPVPVATINFLSDDEQNNLPPGFPPVGVYPPVPGFPPFFDETAPAVVVMPIIDAITGVAYPLTVTMISDLDPPGTILPPQLSDLLSVKTPEPSTLCLAALGVISIVGMRLRRRLAATG